MYLDEIVAYKRANRPSRIPDLEKRAADAPPVRSFLATLGTYRTVLIAECKQSSPSAGQLIEQYDPVTLAAVYEKNGASAISVLTDEKFFGGSLADLAAVRSRSPFLCSGRISRWTKPMSRRPAPSAPILILLIARILEDDQLKRLATLAAEMGMEAIFEVHDESEVQRALEASAQIIGINNRDLEDFRTDIATTERLLPLIPSPVVTISESGIRTGHDVARLREAGARGVLVGEALIRFSDPAALLQEMVDAGCPDCWPAVLATESGIDQ